MFSPIITERLILRRLLPRDVESMFSYRSDPLVAKYQDWKPDSIEHAGMFIDTASGKPDIRPPNVEQIKTDDAVPDERVSAINGFRTCCGK